VATPIGNLGDISRRAIDILGGVDLVACEDTRVTGKLLSRLGLAADLFSYHEHNAAGAGAALLAKLQGGAAIALVSDAGSPLVSDPGQRLVQACHEGHIPVTAVPGASAVVTALQLSGLPAQPYLFAGFLPRSSGERRSLARTLAAVPATLVFFESPNRLGASLADLGAVLGNRPAAIARELTKLHEEVIRGDLAELADRYRTSPARGEVVVVVGPPDGEVPVGDQEVDERLAAALAGGASLKDAAQLVAAETGIRRRDVYARALRLAGTGPKSGL
jgi:16S rRNA (cytidine1402-2'-O)-methyltransferase